MSSKYTWVYSQDYTYRNNGDNQTTQIASLDYVRRDGGTSFDEFSLSYEYDAVGNISKITGTTRTDQSASYTYDAQGQLTSETNQNGTYTYTYDTYGNIRSVSGTASHSYTYGDSEWLDLLTAYDGKSITYDAIGNPNVWHNDTGDWSLSWANGRQLTRATKGSHVVGYTYDLAGIRDSKTVDGVTYNYITQNGQVVRQTWGGNTLDVIYDNNSKPCELKYNGTLYYYVLNLQGDVIAIVSENGACVATYTYDAWGNVISQSGTLAAVNPIRYRGYYYDSETGLYYLGSRYYDPAVKRFINADGYASTGQGYIGYNMFAYCNNCPVVLYDSNGTEAAVAIIVIAGSAITTGFFTYLDGGSVGDIIKNSLRAGAVTGLAWFTGELYGTVVAKIASAMVGAAITNIVLQDSNSKMDWISLGIDVICSAASEVFSTALSKFNPDLDDASKALGGVGIDVGKSAIVTAHSIFKESSRGSRPPLPPITKQQRLNVVQRRATRNKTKQALF